MSDGFWVIAGAVVGAAGSISTTALSAHLSRLRKFPAYETRAEKLLKEILKDGGWHDINTLMNVTGMARETVKEYLVAVGARGSRSDGKKWALESEQPLSGSAAND